MQGCEFLMIGCFLCIGMPKGTVGQVERIGCRIIEFHPTTVIERRVDKHIHIRHLHLIDYYPLRRSLHDYSTYT